MAQRTRQFKIVFALVFLILSVSTVILMAHLGHEELARPVLSIIAALSIIVIIYPELYRKGWFWMTMLIFTALHIPLLTHVHWNTDWMPSPFLILFCLADIATMIGIISFIQKFVGAENSPK